MSLEQAIEYALSKEKPARSSESKSSPADELLTRRQREICALIARGLSNRQIAGELTLSERTVETHVGKLLKKLELNSRSQVAAWAQGRFSEETDR